MFRHSLTSKLNKSQTCWFQAIIFCFQIFKISLLVRVWARLWSIFHLLTRLIEEFRIKIFNSLDRDRHRVGEIGLVGNTITSSGATGINFHGRLLILASLVKKFFVFYSRPFRKHRKSFRKFLITISSDAHASVYASMADKLSLSVDNPTILCI